MTRLDTTGPTFEGQFATLLHAARDTASSVDAAVASILADVPTRGDNALIEATARYDHQDLTPATLRVTEA